MGATIIQCGCRIHCEGEYGTVLYIGSIQGFEGTWLGVEWDNPNRGKHSGCYKDVTYFTTKVLNAGSFIKVAKADLGISCTEAVRMKYDKSIDSNKPINYINLPQKSGQKRHIEMVGMEKIMGKQSNFCCLTDIALCNMLVNGAGKDNELKELVPNVTELDLSQNLLSSWTEVNEIVKQLCKLSILILSKNCLKIPEECQTFQENFKTVKMLALNNMGYCWEEILSSAVMWPLIQELYVLDNKISNLAAPSPPVFSQLKVLRLDNNPIAKWTEVNKLGKLTNLEELHLENTSLESIEFPNTSPTMKTDLFPSLKILYVRVNNLKSWRDISELNKLESLKNLMVNKNPIIQSVSPETARQIIIAKIPGLHTLNRTEVERSEKRGAELDYLKRYRKEWIENGGSNNLSESNPSESFVTDHPTYHSLLLKHGAADENEVKGQSTLIKDNLISVRIFSPLMPDKPALTKKLPTEMTVGKLRALAQRIFKVGANELTLTHLFKEDESQKTAMDNNLRQLSFYSISDQDKICVEW